MSIQINLKSLPSRIREATSRGMENTNLRNVSARVPFGFPPSKSALWDPTPIGDTMGLHLIYYRNPKLMVVEKAVRLAYLHAKSERKQVSLCFLLASVMVDEDEEGITLTVDRFDPGREATDSVGKVPNAVLPGDFIIPCTVKNSRLSSGEVTWDTFEDFSNAFKHLQYHLCNKEALDLSKLLTVRAQIIYTENMDNLNFDLYWAAVTVANMCESTPVKPVPVIPTALARNLSSNVNIAQIQGKHKCGYLTMDQTRKLLLVLESDPKVYTLPLVGIWLSGIKHVHSPQVWACCLRYMFSSSLQERVVSEAGSFLIVLYSLTHKEPEFYACLPCCGNKELRFQLLNSSEALHLFKNADASDKQPIQCDLSEATQKAEIDFFNGISKDVSIASLYQRSSPNKLSASDHDSGVEDEDVSPRPTPSPHPASQQVARIHPSVPELSIVFDGSFIESKTMPKRLVNANNINPLAQATLPSRNASAAVNVYNQNQHSDTEQPFDIHIKPSVRRLSNQLHQETPAIPKTPTTWKGCPTRRKNSRSSSSSSSSSPSTPRSGASPDASVLQDKKQSQKFRPDSETDTPRRGPPTVRRSSTLSSSQPVMPPQSLQHSPLQNSRRLTDMQMPVSPAPPSPCNTCSCYQLNGPIQCCPLNKCQGMGNRVCSCSPEIQSEMPSESSCSVLPQSLAYPSVCCNPVCVTRGKLENSFPTGNLISPASLLSSPAGPCSQSCAAHTACTQAPMPSIVSDNGMMGLSADAYRLLAEQDRQLKLLQAQIQRLLEGQALQSCSTNHTPSQRQVEFIAMSTPGLQMTKSVSIAVSTGASLFWNSPFDGQDDCVSQAKQKDADNSDLTISVNPEEDTSHTSIASSLKAVDICSFTDSTQDTEDEPNQLSDSLSISHHLPNGQESPVFLETSPSGEMKMCLPTEATEGRGNYLIAANKVQQPVQTVASIPSDHVFYQDLLGQVNHLLKTSSEYDEPSVKADTSDQYATSQISTKTKKKNSQTYRKENEQNAVLTATLKQLSNLGVDIGSDSSDTVTKNTTKVENASVLACINPEAVIPRLNYVSFANVGMSGFSSSGVDLSMEANAIALKYLNESQLSQLSQSRSGQNSPLEYSSFHSILSTSTEKSMVGLSLISPSNMSFATKKYMKRYGLIQSNDSSSDDENEMSNGAGQCHGALDINSRPIPEGLSCRQEHSEQGIERRKNNVELCHNETPSSDFLPKSDVNTLRTVTEERSRNIFQPPDQNPLQTFKELHPNGKTVTGKVQYTSHPEKENAREMHFFPEKLHTSFELKHTDNPKSVGDFLDVNRLRQLPKLF